MESRCVGIDEKFFEAKNMPTKGIECTLGHQRILSLPLAFDLVCVWCESKDSLANVVGLPLRLGGDEFGLLTVFFVAFPASSSDGGTERKTVRGRQRGRQRGPSRAHMPMRTPHV